MSTKIPVIAAALIAVTCVAVDGPNEANVERRLRVHLYAGDTRPRAPLAPWYRSRGITDVWLYPVKGAFAQDQRPETQKTPQQLEEQGVLEAYRQNNIRHWWFERPVPDVFYERSKTDEFPAVHLWDDSARTEGLWREVCDNIRRIYPLVQNAGFEGIVYDNEAYYSYTAHAENEKLPWLWGGHEDQMGRGGNYYRRGREVGEAVMQAWPHAKVIMVYAFGYEGERWWYEGFADAGLDVYLGVEHTYGAGPHEQGEAWYQHWWDGRTTVQTCDWKRTLFPFIQSNQHILAGLFPVDFGAGEPNYAAKYFRQQLASAANDDPHGPVDVWLWPQGPFTPESWQEIDYIAGDGAEDYLQALRDFSAQTSE